MGGCSSSCTNVSSQTNHNSNSTHVDKDTTSQRHSPGNTFFDIQSRASPPSSPSVPLPLSPPQQEEEEEELKAFHNRVQRMSLASSTDGPRTVSVDELQRTHPCLVVENADTEETSQATKSSPQKCTSELMKFMVNQQPKKTDDDSSSSYPEDNRTSFVFDNSSKMFDDSSSILDSPQCNASDLLSPPTRFTQGPPPLFSAPLLNVDNNNNNKNESCCAPLFQVYMSSGSGGAGDGDDDADYYSSAAVQSTYELVRGVDADNNKTLNEYVVVAPIGRGSFGKVKLAVDTIKNTTVAIKIVNLQKLEKYSMLSTSEPIDGVKSLTPLQLAHQEIEIMKTCRHPNLVRLINVIKDPSAPKLYLVMEYMEGGPLWRTPMMRPTEESSSSPNNHLRSFCESTPSFPELRNNILDVLHGLQFLHGKGVIHMDIKPENILVTKDGECKLADFGVCTVLSSSCGDDHENDVIRSTQGTPLYFAPEMLLMESSNNNSAAVIHGKATDVWALGITVYILVYGCLPFTGVTLK
eukprot:PhF_6_TR24764/c1_g1_i4/m.33981/K07359/CAMKK2; calcium/calmodulin-dependent protein kinase kinase 2